MIGRVWEHVGDGVVPRRRVKGGRRSYLPYLAPGDVKRKITGGSGEAVALQALFAWLGVDDHHAETRTVDKVRYVYMWRDRPAAKVVESEWSEGS